MRLSRLVMLAAGTLGFAACRSDTVTTPALPPLAGVRFINALSDTGAVDIRMIDQVEFSAVANQLAFRAGTEHQPTEAKARHIRVFPNSFNQAITQLYMLDTTITLTADTKVTLLLTGSARAKTVKFIVITDSPPAVTAGQIAVRAVNAASGAIDAYVVNDTTSAISAGTALANVAPLATSAYVTRATGTAWVRVTDAGSGTVNFSAPGPVSPALLAGELPAAGVNSAGTAFSVFYFPRSVAGTTAPQTAAFLKPIAIWFVDRVPTS